MSETRKILQEIRRKRWQEDAHLSTVRDDQMYLETAFTLEQMITRRPGEITGVEARFLFLRRADHMEEHAIQIEHHLRYRFDHQQTQTDRIWARNHEARGDLYAALCGLNDEHLDIEPVEPPGEWSLRKILEHLIIVERLYTSRAARAVERYRAGEPYGQNQSPEQTDEFAGATLKDLIIKLDEAREESLQILQHVTDDDLGAPMIWARMDVDLRFQLMRYAHHEREHTAHIRKWRQQCGLPFSESARLLGLCWQQSGRLEGILAGIPDELLDRDPGDGEWPIRRVLEHLASGETYFKVEIESALD